MAWAEILVSDGLDSSGGGSMMLVRGGDTVKGPGFVFGLMGELFAGWQVHVYCDSDGTRWRLSKRDAVSRAAVGV